MTAIQVPTPWFAMKCSVFRDCMVRIRHVTSLCTFLHIWFALIYSCKQLSEYYKFVSSDSSQMTLPLLFDKSMAGESIESNFVSMKPAVEFLNILDQYSYNDNLKCTYKFNDYSPQEGDRVAIFKLGWNFVKDYIVFEWAPTENTKNKQHSVIFKKHVLPKSEFLHYQICYISGENVLYGASSPFQFAEKVSPVMTQSGLPLATGEDVCDRTISENNDELHKLKEENEMLRASLKAVIAQKNGEGSRNYDSEISELRKITDELKEALGQHQRDINMLKQKITNGAEEYRKLYLDKVRIEKKYDKLKGKVEGNGKTVAELVNFDIGDLKSIPPFPFSK